MMGSSVVNGAILAPLDGKANFRRTELLSGGGYLLTLIVEWTVLLSSGYVGGPEHVAVETPLAEELDGAIPPPVTFYWLH